MNLTIKSLGICLAALLLLAVGSVAVKADNDVTLIDTTPITVGPPLNDDFTGTVTFGEFGIGPADEARLRRELFEACVNGEQMWDARICGYSTELPAGIRQQLSQIRIVCQIATIPGEGALANARPIALASMGSTAGGVTRTTTVTLEALVTFDIEFLDLMSQFDLLNLVAAHEIAHGLGFNGTIWGDMGLSGPLGGVGLNQYIGGTYALPIFRRESGNPLETFIPLEQTGAGSAGSHYATGVSTVFDRLAIDGSQAVMLAAANSGDFFVPETTWGIFADVGYAVTGVNGQFQAPPGSGAGIFNKTTGPGRAPFANAGGGGDASNIRVRFPTGNIAIFKRAGSDEGSDEEANNTTAEEDPYNLQRHRWTKFTGRNR